MNSLANLNPWQGKLAPFISLRNQATTGANCPTFFLPNNYKNKYFTPDSCLQNTQIIYA